LTNGKKKNEATGFYRHLLSPKLKSRHEKFFFKEAFSFYLFGVFYFFYYLEVLRCFLCSHAVRLLSKITVAFD
jgi:hypothetical protein